jgi:CheY-like chemotaxis protein
MLRELGKLVGYTFPRNITIQVDVARELWPVVGDVIQLYQALMNLLLNARDAMPHGGKLMLTAENVPAGAGGTAQVLVRVRDTGVGMSPNVLANVFNPFFSTKEPGQGSGLGLTTALEIVRAHGGTLDCTSAVGAGSEFRLLLPSVVQQQAPAPAADKPELPAGNGERILIIDDERSVRELARAILETYGYRTVLAADAGSALATCRERSQELHAALVDYYLPDMDGAALCRRLRELCPVLRPILTSGHPITPERLTAADLPTAAFVSKPFTATRLLKAVRARLSATSEPPAASNPV